jgi:uroporphyrinogen decarboxylase
MFPDGSFIDEWGLRRKAGKFYLDVASPAPLAHAEDVDEIENYAYWPDPNNDRSAEGLRKVARALDDAGYAVCGLLVGTGGPLETANHIRGFSKFMEDLHLRPRIARAILDKIVELQTEMVDMFLDEVGDYLTLMTTSDDLGSQRKGFFSLKTYRDLIKPAQGKVADAIHRKTKAKLLMHCCGNVEMYINDLIEIGIDVLNPVQPECPDMSLEDLKRKYGDKIAFHGGIGTQHILPRGTTSDVEKEVMRAIRAAAAGGGYVAAPSQMIQPDVPPQNVCALYDAVLKHGWYPIRL